MECTQLSHWIFAKHSIKPWEASRSHRARIPRAPAWCKMSSSPLRSIPSKATFKLLQIHPGFRPSLAMTRFNLLRFIATLVGFAMLVGFVAPGSRASISPQTPETKPTGPTLPVLTSSFRRELETIGVPNAKTSTSEQLDDFARLVLQSNSLTGISRAPYLDWIARVYLFRGEAASGLPFARSSYVLRSRLLGSAHPLCQRSRQLIEALQHPDRLPPDERASVGINSPDAPVPDTPEFIQSELAIASRDLGQIEKALVALNYDLNNLSISIAEIYVTDLPMRERFLLIAQLLNLSDHPQLALQILGTLSALELSHPDTGNPATIIYSDVLFETGNLADCLSLLEVLPDPPTELGKLSILWRKARVENSMGHWKEAQRNFDVATNGLSKLQLEPPAIAWKVALNQAETYYERGQLALAYNEATKTTLRFSLALGVLHYDAINSRRLAALANGQLGNFEDARAELERLSILSSETFGPEFSLTLHIKLDLASTLSASPRFYKYQGSASELFSVAIEGYASIYDAKDWRVLLARHALALHLCRIGRLFSSVSELESIAATMREQAGPATPLTLKIQGNLGAIYDRLGRTEAARKLYIGNFETARDDLGAEHPLAVQYLCDLIEHYQLHHRYEDEEPLLKELLDLLLRSTESTEVSSEAVRAALRHCRDAQERSSRTSHL